MLPLKKTEQESLVSDNVVISGGGNFVTVNLNVYTPPTDLKQLRTDYLNYIRRTHYILDFKGISQVGSIPLTVSLESVYTPLFALPEVPITETLSQRTASSITQKAIQIEQAITNLSKVVVLGDPGSGKTTLLKHIALSLSDQPEAALPILVPLSAYSESLSRADHNLQQYLAEYFSGRAQGLANLAPLFDSALSQGQAIVLLDGLDEVHHERSFIVSKIEAFAREASAQGNKVIVTSRIVGYREAPLNSREWMIYTLLDLNLPEIRDFVFKWSYALEGEASGDATKVREHAERLYQAFEQTPSLIHLRSNPLLLAILLLIHRQRLELPKHRVTLYELYLSTLIDSWNKARSLDRRVVGEPQDYFEVASVLAPFALRLHEQSAVSGMMPEESIRAWLIEFYVSEWRLPLGEAIKATKEFLENIRKASNVLIERESGQFGFLNLAFEEYMAARGIAQLNESESILTLQRHIADPRWQEVIVLTIGIWSIIQRRQLTASYALHAMLEMGKEGVLLAKKCLQEYGAEILGYEIAQQITAVV
jgi:predicted NACHT family NTPase